MNLIPLAVRRKTISQHSYTIRSITYSNFRYGLQNSLLTMYLQGYSTELVRLDATHRRFDNLAYLYQDSLVFYKGTSAFSRL
jgi:hypothetical protein